ncbi:hypothetical protein [Pseudanabaena sp. CCNP1317]|nr:hypothetical protein [Pseudanabaena sp. CCNP1317]MEA5487260.1 hypothetical protein [Pseudanabaena sp. CCNP1317]
MRRREASPHTIWVLICPDTGGYSYNSQKCWQTFVNYSYSDRLYRQVGTI